MSTEIPHEIEASPYGAVTAPMVSHLHAMRPWLLFLAIVGFIGTALVVIMALAMAVMGATIFAAQGEMSESAGMVMGVVLCLVYLAIGALYGFWSFLLLSNANAISDMKKATSVAGLMSSMEVALDRQRRFWKITGIAVIVSLVAYAGLIVIFVIIAVLAAAATGGAS